MRNRIFCHAANHPSFSTSSISSRLKKAGYSSGLWWDVTDFALTLGFGIFALKHIVKDCEKKRIAKEEAESQARSQLAAAKQTVKDNILRELAAKKLAEIQKASIEGCGAATPSIRALRRHT